MPGGIFAISTSWFYDIGAYDEQMEIWGGENIDISLRTWMCGGGLYIVPCSRVGHVFRQFSPYRFSVEYVSVFHLIRLNPGFSIADRNKQRVAEVWLDEFKKYFYEFSPSRQLEPLYSLELGQRFVLKRRLHCQPFSWYMNEVYPELTIPKKVSNDNCMSASLQSNEANAHAPRCDEDEPGQRLFYQKDQQIIVRDENNIHWAMHTNKGRVIVSASYQNEFSKLSVCATNRGDCYVGD